jgi:hypothetical protein
MSLAFFLSHQALRPLMPRDLDIFHGCWQDRDQQVAGRLSILFISRRALIIGICASRSELADLVIFLELYGRKQHHTRTFPHSNARWNFGKKAVVLIRFIVHVERNSRCPQAPICLDRQKRGEAKNAIISWLQILVFG